MSSKPSNAVPYHPCDKYRRNSGKSVKIKLPKKVVISKKWHQNCSHDSKSQSTGVFDTKEVAKPKKTTKSEPTVPRNTISMDFCKKCGDTDENITTAVSEYTGTTSVTNKSCKTTSTEREKRKVVQISEKQKHVRKYHKNEECDEDDKEVNQLTSRTSKMHVQNEEEKLKGSDKKEILQEYYKNDRFESLYDSMHEFDTGLRNKNTLDTITEVNEKSQSQKASTESNMFIIDTSDDEGNIKQLKEFRDKNYFECHSARSRVDNKACVIAMKDHKCSYKFYLNDRLFPEALSKDYNDNVRCVECHLPLDLSSDDVGNGTIQAKVKVGNDMQDMMLLLPVKAPLIVQQKKKKKDDQDTVYFGVIKLDQNGNSMFNRNLPSDSLALRYQRGYREFVKEQSYKYEKVDGDVLVI